MDIITALEVLKKLELKVQDLYAYYHTLFGADKAAAGVFYELSLEEKSHADLIDYQLRIIKKNKLMFNDVEFDMESLNQLIAKRESQISSKKPISFEGAVKFGMELENDALEYHYKTLIAKSNSEVGELINKLGTFDKEHFDKLKNLDRERAGASAPGRRK